MFKSFMRFRKILELLLSNFNNEIDGISIA
jgi:hypothetical protein